MMVLRSWFSEKRKRKKRDIFLVYLIYFEILIKLKFPPFVKNPKAYL
jgi:hypothetical protein